MEKIKVGSTVILGDCVEVMKGFEDNQFDLAIVDPPYKLLGPSKFASKKRGKNITLDRGKTIGISIGERPPKEYWDELFRVSKNQIVFGMQYFIPYLYPTQCVIVWDKRNGKSRFSDCELCWTSFHTAVRKVEIWNEPNNRIHITQKPIKLYKWILKNYAEEGMKILDTHLGSGSSRIAADSAGMDFTGIEINKEYFDLSEKRFNNYKSQLRIEDW